MHHTSCGVSGCGSNFRARFGCVPGSNAREREDGPYGVLRADAVLAIAPVVPAAPK